MCLHCSAITINIYDDLNFNMELGILIFVASLYVFSVPSCVVLARNRSFVRLIIL